MVWPYVKSFLKSAIIKSNEQDRVDLSDIIIDIISGNAQLFVAVDNDEIIAAVVTVFADQYNGKSLNIYLLGGKRITEWVDNVHAEIVKFAKLNNVRWIDVCTRPGIGKLIEKRFGYKSQNICYTLGVCHG